jgi:signal transduction histidine kinase
MPIHSVRGVKLRPTHLTFVAAGAAAAVTIAVALTPFLDFAYRRPSLHVVLETASGLVAVLAAYLVLGRFRERPRLSDLTLATALVLFAAAALLLSALPIALASDPARSGFSTWAPLVARLLGALLFAVSAFVPDRAPDRPGRAAAAALGAAGFAVLGIVALVGAFSGSLPVGIDPNLSREARETPVFVGHPAILALQVLAGGLFGVAAVGLTRRAEATADDLLAWFGAASAIGFFARVNYVLFPSLYSDWVYVGDLLRLAFYAVIVVGAAQQIGRYRHEATEAAVLRERRRVARDLHDGLAHELAYIVTQARSALELGRGTPETERIIAAADRALYEARRAIAALTEPIDQPLADAVAAIADDLATRAGADAVVNVKGEVDVGLEKREALLRIVREAVTNATRHGGARTVTVELENVDGLKLRVLDDGTGFDPEQCGTGFGLTSMRERAEALGGEFRIRSRRGAGTRMEVLLP